MTIPAWLALESTFTISRPNGAYAVTIYDESVVFSYTGIARTLREAARRALEMRESDEEDELDRGAV